MPPTIIDNAIFSQTDPTPNSPRNNPSLAGILGGLNDEVANVEKTLIDGFIKESAGVSFISTTSFTTIGDSTSYYTKNRILRFNGATSPSYTTVVSSSYDSPGNLTTVIVTDAVVPTPLTTVDLYIQPKGATDLQVTPKGPATMENKISKKMRVTVVCAPTTTIDLSLGEVFELTLNQNTTIAFSNMAKNRFFILRIRQNGTGNYTVTWPSSTYLKWPDGIAPVQTPTANKMDKYGFEVYDFVDPNFYTEGSVIGQNF